MGGAHHCAVAEPEEDLDESPLGVDDCQPQDSELLEWVRSNADRFAYTDERGLHYLLWQLVDNAVDEATAGHATAVKVRLLGDGGVEVSDNGRGISAGDPDPFLPTIIRIAAALPGDGDDTSDNRYGDFGGTRAAGAWIVNALSTRMQVESSHDDYPWDQRYERGEPGGFERTETTTAMGTAVRFWADAAIFASAAYDFETVALPLQQLAFLNSGLTIELVDQRPADKPRSRTFCFTDGLVRYVERIDSADWMHAGVIHFSGRSTACDVEIAMRWTGAYSTKIHTFVNNVDTSGSGGTHKEGFRHALTNVISRYAKERKLLRDAEPDLSADAVCEGFAAVVSVNVAGAVFEGQAAPRLTNPEAEMAVQQLCELHLTDWLEANPAGADVIARKAISSSDEGRRPRRSHCYRI